MVNRCDLMRQRLDLGGVNGQVRVEQVGEVDAICLRNNLEGVGVCVEAPGQPATGYIDALLVLAVKQLAGELALLSL